jgi:hypothetical protein
MTSPIVTLSIYLHAIPKERAGVSYAHACSASNVGSNVVADPCYPSIKNRVDICRTYLRDTSFCADVL